MAGWADRILNAAFRWGDSLSMSQWLLVLIAVLGAGVFLLRGFGSRSKY